jgi:hypothetical protein
MGAKSSKAAIVVSPSKTFGYDTFGNYEDTDTDTDINTFIYDNVINDELNIYSIIMAIVLGYSIVFYSFVYFRRQYSRYK